VKAGEEILVLDRHETVARIVPLTHSGDDDQELLALAAKGKLRRGEGHVEQAFWEMPAPRVPPAALRHAVDQERDEE